MEERTEADRLSRQMREYYEWIRENIWECVKERGISPKFNLDRIHSTGSPQNLVTFTVSDRKQCVEVTFKKEDIE